MVRYTIVTQTRGDGSRIGELLDDAPAPRIRLLSLNVDTTGHDPATSVLEQHRMRWSHEDLRAHPQQGWANRVKTIARCRRSLPIRSIHKLSPGRHYLLDPDVARIHHFRVPTTDLSPPLAYSVDDPLPPLATRGRATDEDA